MYLSAPGLPPAHPQGRYIYSNSLINYVIYIKCTFYTTILCKHTHTSHFIYIQHIYAVIYTPYREASGSGVHRGRSRRSPSPTHSGRPRRRASRSRSHSNDRTDTTATSSYKRRRSSSRDRTSHRDRDDSRDRDRDRTRSGRDLASDRKKYAGMYIC